MVDRTFFPLFGPPGGFVRGGNNPALFSSTTLLDPIAEGFDMGQIGAYFAVLFALGEGRLADAFKRGEALLCYSHPEDERPFKAHSQDGLRLAGVHLKTSVCLPRGQCFLMLASALSIRNARTEVTHD